jgi:hypothetical protein
MKMVIAALSTVLVLGALAGPRYASGDDDRRRIKTRLSGIEEVPAVSTTGSGEFRAKVEKDGTVSYELSYAALEGNVLQSHIHFGQFGVNGGVMVFLCTNLDNGPAGTPGCPEPDGKVTGTFGPDQVVGPSGQGITSGEFEEVLRAIRQGVAYVNVHTDLRPGGEIRGQLD